ncbi:conserved Plasmodium protein, unknown function [Plasmodium gonderi]|uniref:Uncharacterized protein n=1 Tax=Plasmodium gonderi TaxID=77519 RepID=A0A1Y1JMA8_PLAGO|nr:conserved Plasmodium protein, unknown function [Plasmodium gonderi]GAW83370.1 conserved Plasmodium protein, unknown function [Plasmodium gonderi]
MRNFFTLLFALMYTVYAQLPYEVLNIYKPLNSHSVNAFPGDKNNEEYEVKDIKNGEEKEHSENSLKRLAERYHKDIEEGDQNILEELDQLNDIIGDRTLRFNIF